MDGLADFATWMIMGMTIGTALILIYMAVAAMVYFVGKHLW